MPVDVLYVLGKGRSGSTLLDDVLGQLDGYTSLGELRQVWEWGFERAYDCSCGEPVPRCPFWSEVLVRTLGPGTAAADIAAVRRLQDRVLAWARAPVNYLRTGTRRAHGGDVRRYAEVMRRLYSAARDLTGAAVLIDSSKWPAHPGALGLIGGVQPSLLHLVRDPRAVAYSYRRHKETSGRQPKMPRFGSLHSSLSWTARNISTELTRTLAPSETRSVRLRYEDFAASPRECVREILQSLRLPAAAGDPFLDERTVVLGESHMVGGNPRRFERGRVHITLDEEWHERMTRPQATIVSLLCGTLMDRYGYARQMARR